MESLDKKVVFDNPESASPYIKTKILNRLDGFSQGISNPVPLKEKAIRTIQFQFLTTADALGLEIPFIVLLKEGMYRTDRLNNGLKGYEPSADIQKRLLDAMNARTEEALTGKTVYPAPSNTPVPTREQLLAQPKGLYSEGGLYYYFDYKHPKSGAPVPLKCLPDLIDFDVRRNMNLVNIPLLMMAGSTADTLYMTEDAFNLATGTENKELYLIDGATHIQTYYVPEYVEKETLKLVEFFGKNL